MWDTGGLRSSLWLMAHPWPIKIRNYYYYKVMVVIIPRERDCANGVGCMIPMEIIPLQTHIVMINAALKVSMTIEPYVCHLSKMMTVFSDIA